MPTYVYKRDDGTTFEIKQRISEEPLEVCPTTGQKVKRVISSAGLVFKGSGFYLTDYVRNNDAKGKNAPKTKEEAVQSSPASETKSSSEKTDATSKSEKSKPTQPPVKK